MSGGAYRDAGAAIERAEALEREVEELRAENELLRSQLSKDEAAPRRIAELERALTQREEPISPSPPRTTIAAEAIIERDNLRHEVKNLRAQIVHLQQTLAQRPAAPATSDDAPWTDNRDAVIKRLIEERDELYERLRSR